MIQKFRAWDKETSKMCNVGALYFSRDYELEIVSTHLHNDYVANRNLGQVTLMQSTGLKDKNGVEIFEGDIVLENGMEQVISLGEQRYEENFGDVVYYIGFNIFTKWGYSSIDPKEHEVIGNIYENPELLNLR